MLPWDVDRLTREEGFVRPSDANPPLGLSERLRRRTKTCDGVELLLSSSSLLAGVITVSGGGVPVLVSPRGVDIPLSGDGRLGPGIRAHCGISPKARPRAATAPGTDGDGTRHGAGEVVLVLLLLLLGVVDDVVGGGDDSIVEVII